MTAPFVNFPVPTTPLSLTNVLATGTTVTRSLGDRFARWFFVQDYGAVGDGVADDTAAILSALAAAALNGAGVGIVQLMTRHKFSSIIQVPQGIFLLGQGYGDFQGNPDAPSKTLLTWAGGATDGIITQGANGAGGSWVGGGISNFTVDCQGVARSGVKIIDIGQFYDSNVNVLNPTITAWWLTNTATVLTCFGTFDGCSAVCTSGASVNASCVRVEGTAPGGGGVTLMRWGKFRGQHRNGHGVDVVKCGDGFYWENPDLFRPDGNTGNAINVSNNDPINNTCGGWTIVAPLFSGAVNVITPQAAGGWRIIAGNDTDVNVGLPLPQLTGAGQHDVSFEGQQGSRYGMAAIVGPGYFCKTKHDMMQFIRWDSANSVLFTSDGAFASSNTGSGTITDAGQNSGAVQIQTGNVIGNITSFFNPPTSGVTQDFLPQLIVKYAPLDTGNAVHRVGLFGDFNDPPTNGIYIESDSSVNANFRLISVKAGVQTVVISTTTVDQFLQWRIEVWEGGVVFLFRAPTFTGWNTQAQITTNIPLSTLSFGVWSKTRANAGVRVHVYDMKLAYKIS